MDRGVLLYMGSWVCAAVKGMVFKQFGLGVRENQGRSVRKERLRLRRYCKLGRSGDSSSGNFFFQI